MNLDQIKNKLQSLQSKNAGGGSSEKKNVFWKPAIGKQNVRVVPYKFNKDNPFIEMHFHYNFGNKTIISPINWGEKDPIVEFAKQLRKTNEKENWRMAKKLDPKMRIFVPVVVRGEEEQGVKFWAFGKELYMDFLNLAENEDIGDFTDIVNGRDIVVTTVGPESTGTSYNKSSIMPRTKETPLVEDKTLLKRLLEEQTNPMDLFKKYSYDEMKEILQDWLTPEAEEGEEGTESVGTATPNVSLKPKVNQAEKFDALFEE